MSDVVVGLLVTGPPEKVMEWWLPFAGVLNSFDRRKETTHFALWNDPPCLDRVLRAAFDAGVSVQRIVGAGEHETYETLYEHPGVGLWPPVKGRRRNRRALPPVGGDYCEEGTR